MSISRDQVRHIAHLARIELTEDEERLFEKELSSILEFVSRLNEADTQGVPPMTGGTELTGVMRPDRIQDPDLEAKSAVLFAAAPAKAKGWVKVKAVFGL